MLTRFIAVLMGLVLGGATVHAAVVKNFEFNVDGVLPSADPQIELFVTTPSPTETEVFSVSGGLLISPTKWSNFIVSA